MIKDYEKEKKLGEGSYGEIFKVKKRVIITFMF